MCSGAVGGESDYLLPPVLPPPPACSPTPQYDCPPQGSPLTVTVPLSFVVDYYVDTVGSLTVTIERQPSASGDVCKIKQALFETTGAYAFGKGPNAGVHFYASPNPVPFDNNPGFNNDLDTFLFNYTSGTAFTKADLYTMYTAPSALLWQLTIPADQKIYLFGQAYVFVPSACTKRSA